MFREEVNWGEKDEKDFLRKNTVESIRHNLEKNRLLFIFLYLTVIWLP